MVVFQELRISPDGSTLFIDANIASGDYYKNLYIDSIYIDTEETFTPNGNPSSKAKKVYTNTSNNNSVRSVRLELTEENINLGSLSNHIFYVYVKVSGVPDPTTPCYANKIYTIGVVLNWFPIYQKSLKVLGVIKDNCCSFPKEATDFIIKLKGFEISLRTSQYIKANQIYNSWFKNIKSDIINLNCGCK